MKKLSILLATLMISAVALPTYAADEMAKDGMIEMITEK